ncbi:MAG: HAMP domain-containing histidine kinase [Eubacterium sp.]|nr:HAMP domain-containing histidine kinase [Eubacterium sp.]
MEFLTEPLLWAALSPFIFLHFTFIIKIHLMQKSADEIRTAFADRLQNDTNTLIDITSRDRHMRALAESINEQLRLLRSERHRFIQGDIAVKETITNISHDLRTPLTAIFGYLDILQTEEVSTYAARCLAIIRERAGYLKQLTEELFLYSVATSKEQDTILEKVVLNQALEESILAHYAALKSCKITPEISMPEEPVLSMLNTWALSRIFENILSNTLKYSDGDLQITMTKEGEITFSNHAHRLNKVESQKIFDRLYTVETGARSTGLGLSIARTLTEQMQGRIEGRYANGILSIRLSFHIIS